MHRWVHDVHLKTHLSIVVLWVIFLGRSLDCIVGAWESPFCLFDQAADNAPRHQTREHLSVHPPWAPTLVRVNMDERWKLAKITVMIVLLVVLVVTDKLCICFFLPCQWNLAALQFCRSTRCCEVGRSGSWSLGCRASVWQHVGNSRFLTEFRNDMKWHEMTIWQKWPILFWVKDGRAGCRMLQMFAASGVWQTYADVMGPIEAAFLVPIRTKPTPWLELRFICLQLLGRLRPAWLFFQTNSVFWFCPAPSWNTSKTNPSPERLWENVEEPESMHLQQSARFSRQFSRSCDRLWSLLPRKSYLPLGASVVGRYCAFPLVAKRHRPGIRIMRCWQRMPQSAAHWCNAMC